MFELELVKRVYEKTLASEVSEVKFDEIPDKLSEILSKYSYESMVFSLKSLKLERWYTEEEIKFMNLKFVSKK